MKNKTDFQFSAATCGLKKTGNLLLENHLTGCVVDAMTNGKKEEAIKEVMTVFKKRS